MVFRKKTAFSYGFPRGSPWNTPQDGPRNVVTWDFKKSLVCDDEEALTEGEIGIFLVS